MTVGGLALPFIDVQFVALVTEDAVSCDMVTCCVSSYLTVTSSSDDGVGPIGAILPRGGGGGVKKIDSRWLYLCPNSKQYYYIFSLLK